MFAVIKTGGKQYKVKVGDILQVEKLDAEEGQNVAFNQVLLIEHEEETMIGTPFIEKALVNAEVIANFKDKKVIVFKKKRRKQYKKKRGHRQELTRIKIEEIVSDMKVSPKKKPAPVKKAEEKEKVKKQEPKAEAKPKEKKAETPIKKEAKKQAKKVTAAKPKARAVSTEKSKRKSPVGKKTGTKAAVKAKKSTINKEK